MNLSEFKAWFEGFTEDMKGTPNSKQWKRIQERVAEITEDPTPWPIYIERYVEPYRPYWNPPVWISSYTKICGESSPDAIYNTGGNVPSTSFYSIGQAEAAEISYT